MNNIQYNIQYTLGWITFFRINWLTQQINYKAYNLVYIYLKKLFFTMKLRNKSPFYTLVTPIMLSNRQHPIYIDFHLILSLKLSL